MPVSLRAVPIPASDMYPAHDPTATVLRVHLPDGEQVRVVQHGDPGAPPVVLLHGWGCTAYAWRHVAGPLAGAGWRVLAVDQRGHGLSDKPAAPACYTRDAMVDHLSATLDALGIAGAPIIAHSMGGMVGMSLALRAPARVPRIVLLGAVGFGVVDRAAWTQILPESLTGRLLPPSIPRWAISVALRRSRGEAGLSDGEREVDEYWAPTQFPEFLEAMRLLLHHFRWTPWTPTELAGVTQPMLVMFGDRDPVVKPQQVVPTLARMLKTGTLVVAQGAGHVLHEERPVWTLESVLPFLGAPAFVNG